MEFHSVTFLFTFLPIALLLYYIVPGKLKNIELFLCSLLFYAWGEPVYIFLLLFSIFFNYMSGMYIARNRKYRKSAKKLLVFNIVVNLVILGFFRYGGWLIRGLNSLFSIEIPLEDLPVPVGVAVFTLQALSYIISLYRGDVRMQKNLLNFAVYLTMFPQMITGPIAAYPEMEEQLSDRKLSWEKFSDGVMHLVKGLAKKVLLANAAGAIFVSVRELETGNVSVLSAWLGCIAFAAWVYFEFDGYSDMAIGMGRMFGFELPENFDYPYMAKSMTEFWQRWNMSLSMWFRDYVYAPLGGRSTGILRNMGNIVFVWMLIGLWHGTSLNYAVWGLYCGILLLTEGYLLSGILDKIPGIIRHVFTLLWILIGWVLFFTPTPAAAFRYLKLMLGIGGSGLTDGRGIYLLAGNAVLWILFLLFSVPLVRKIYERLIYGGKKTKTMVNCIVYGGLFLLCIAHIVTGSDFSFLDFGV